MTNPHGRTKYLNMLKDGPKTTAELSMVLGVTKSSVSRMAQKLRKEGVIKSQRVRGARGNVWQHELIGAQQ